MRNVIAFAILATSLCAGLSACNEPVPGTLTSKDPSGRGEGDTPLEVQPDCAIPFDFDGAKDKSVSVDEIADGKAGVFLATEVTYFLNYAGYGMGDQVSKIIKSSIHRPSSADGYATGAALEQTCVGGKRDRETKVSFQVADAIDRKSGSTLYSTERFNAKGDVISNHTRAMAQGYYSLNNYLFDLTDGYFRHPEIRMTRQSDTEFDLFVRTGQSWTVVLTARIHYRLSPGLELFPQTPAPAAPSPSPSVSPQPQRPTADFFAPAPLSEVAPE
ncbi:MAG: hypothetical protein ACXWP5_03855 [Bdellovibrionota bacterium]